MRKKPGGLIARWKSINYRTLAWAMPDRRIIRLGFIWRPNLNAMWRPVVQLGELIPLAQTLGLTYATRQIVSYHDLAGTISTGGKDVTFAAYGRLP